MSVYSTCIGKAALYTKFNTLGQVIFKEKFIQSQHHAFVLGQLRYMTGYILLSIYFTR